MGIIIQLAQGESCIEKESKIGQGLFLKSQPCLLSHFAKEKGGKALL